MDNNDLRNDGQVNNNTYRATSNLNTAIENPQININSAMGVNIKDVGIDNYANINNMDFSNNYSNDNIDNNFSNTFNQFDAVAPNQFDNFSFNENIDKTTVQANSQFISNDDSKNMSSQQNISNYEVNNSLNVPNKKVSYEPVVHEKKRQSKAVAIPKELKIMLFIIFILFIFILIMPYIYDFFKELQLVITTG